LPSGSVDVLTQPVSNVVYFVRCTQPGFVLALPVDAGSSSSLEQTFGLRVHSLGASIAVTRPRASNSND